MNQNDSRKKEELREAVHNLLSSLPIIEPLIPIQFQNQIAALAEYISGLH